MQLTPIALRIHDLQQTIRSLEASGLRAPGTVQLLAVSKGRSPDEILEAIHAGLCDFGENYYQEAVFKINALASYPLCWHFIGPIQRNKTSGIARHFSWVHGLCRVDVAERLNKARLSSAPPLQVCIQVNLDNEPTKSGLQPDEVLDLARAIIALPRLRLRGLMMIPRPEFTATHRYATFLRLAQLLAQLNQTLGLHLDTLSMGMTEDLEDAIRAGSTMVRIGRGLFGEKPIR